MQLISFLKDYSGYLVCDGYDGYNKLKNATRCGCWAHAIYSVINTAIANGFEPKEYMTELFNSNGKIPLPLKSE